MTNNKKSESHKKYGLNFEERQEKIPKASFLQVEDLTINKTGPDNIIIEGENLIALDILSNNYTRKIDVICVDPPYNTGMDWLTYQDHNYVDENDVYPHSKWLSFIKNRLKFAKKLLSDIGVLFINIDEHETGTLLLLCQQIFGEDNVEVLIWPKTNPRFDSNRVEKPPRDIKITHEYIFMCFNNRKKTQLNKMLVPTLKNGEYIDKPKIPETIISGLGTTSSAKDEMYEIFGDRYIFQTPKPMRLVKELIRIASNRKSIVLDFFAGSGTTGHATMDLNQDDGGKRKFILINNNENNICRNITYERIKKVIKKEKYEASLKYFKIIED